MLLARLTEACGISGQEAEIRDLIRTEIASYVDELKTDVMGNLIALRKGRPGSKRVMVAAHMDEVGLLVVGIDRDGFIRFATSGGVDARVLVSKTVVIGKDKVPGVIGAKPIHLQKKDEQTKPFEIDGMFIDIGARSKDDAQKHVRIGDQVAFSTKYEPLGKGFAKAKAFDDRAGCAALIEALKDTHDFDLYGVFTVQEEVGLRGAGVAAFAIGPHLALAVDGTTAHDVTKTPAHMQSSVIGKGPVIVQMDRSQVADRRVVERLVETAEANGIPYQFKRSVTGGTDAGKIRLTLEGIPTSTVSVPCRFIHSPASVMNLEDFANTTRLVRAFLASLDERGLPV